MAGAMATLTCARRQGQLGPSRPGGYVIKCGTMSMARIMLWASATHSTQVCTLVSPRTTRRVKVRCARVSAFTHSAVARAGQNFVGPPSAAAQLRRDRLLRAQAYEQARRHQAHHSLMPSPALRPGA